MTAETHSQLANFIWGICNLLRGPYKRNEYRKVILPLTVLRRFDCLLEPTKAAVLARDAQIGNRPESIARSLLEGAAGTSRSRPYPTDLADAEWELVEPLLSQRRPGDGRGAPRQQDRSMSEGQVQVGPPSASMLRFAGAANRRSLPSAAGVGSRGPTGARPRPAAPWTRAPGLRGRRGG
jgi:hypothetical protein